MFTIKYIISIIHAIIKKWGRRHFMNNRKYMQVFMAVQKALFLRELNMRMSVSRMGLFWTFFQPFFQVLVFIIIKVYIFSQMIHTYDYTVFLALSFIAYYMFKNIISKSLGAFEANKALFTYKQVKPIDTILARTLMEVFITSIILIIFTSIGFYFQFDMNVENFNMVFFAYIWLIIFSFSLSIFLAILNTYVKSVQNIFNMLMVVFVFCSALFYTIADLSPELQTILLLNPLTHFIEMIHGAYFYSLDDTYVDYTYMTLWTIIPLYMGLWFYMKLERRIVSL